MPSDTGKIEKLNMSLTGGGEMDSWGWALFAVKLLIKADKTVKQETINILCTFFLPLRQFWWPLLVLEHQLGAQEPLHQVHD